MHWIFFLLINQRIFRFFFLILILVIGITVRDTRSISQSLLLRLSLTSEIQHKLHPAAGVVSSKTLPGLSVICFPPSLTLCFFFVKIKPWYTLKAYMLGCLTTSASEKNRHEYAVDVVVLPILNVHRFNINRTPINFPFHFLN